MTETFAQVSKNTSATTLPSVQRDIQCFVEREIQERCVNIPVLAGAHDLLDTMSHVLVERAEGM